MKTTIHLRHFLIGLFLSTATGCASVNDEHCWLADGDSTCMAIFGGGFCSSNRSRCEGRDVPYGCVFERPVRDECYSPTGNNVSCAGPYPALECTEDPGESGETGTADAAEGTDASSESSETSEPVEGE